MNEIKIWRYTLPPTDNIEGWGIFLLDSTGMFAAVTDYGNYAFRWTHYGEKDFRKFVADLDRSPDYLLSKVAPHGKEYDSDKTIKGIKEHIIEYRREGCYTKEQAREEWNLINDDELSTLYEFHLWLDKTNIDEAYEFQVESYPFDCIAFATKLIPRLAGVLRSELGAVA